jgi:hypothetical protein
MLSCGLCSRSEALLKATPTQKYLGTALLPYYSAAALTYKRIVRYKGKRDRFLPAEIQVGDP